MRLVPELLRDNRQFRTFFAGEAISLVGDQISLIALPLVAVLASAIGVRTTLWIPVAGDARLPLADAVGDPEDARAAGDRGARRAGPGEGDRSLVRRARPKRLA